MEIEMSGNTIADGKHQVQKITAKFEVNSVVQKNNNTVAVVFADDLQDLNKFVNGFMPRIPILSSKGPAEFYIHVLSTRDMFNITLVSSGMWVRIDGTYTVSSTTVILPMIVEDTVNSFYFPAKALQI